MAIASWPGSRSAELPIGADRQVGGVDRDDRQVGEGVDAVHGAVNWRPSLRTTIEARRVLDDVAVGEDEPVGVVDEPGAGAVWPPRRPPLVRWIVTTAGATLSTALMTALDSSIVTSLTVLASGWSRRR